MFRSSKHKSTKCLFPAKRGGTNVPFFKIKKREAMKFTDSGIIVGVRKYSESSLIVKILSQNHGLYSGFVRGTSSPKNKAIYQNFNLVEFEWSSKIEENLGFFKIEMTKSFLAQIISSPVKLNSLLILSATIEQNLLEREPSSEIFLSLMKLLQKLTASDGEFLEEYIKFEIKLLGILGYGIDLTSCAASGTTDNLHFVSPKSARAVCLEAGERYRDRLLLLPQFLLETKSPDSLDHIGANKEDLLNGLKLSGFFIDKFLTKKPNFKVDVFSSRGQLLNLINSF
ncbi:MAG: DNA repair protein RecO (recombination protein O) [Rickettsiales bacterium]|jgi:DNA repair protein RecO (recombination protein O)